MAAVLAIAVGLVLLGFTYFEHVPSRAADAEHISDQYRQLMSPSGLADLSSGFDGVKAAGAQLDASALPRLRQQLAMDPDQFRAYVNREMPGIAKFDAAAPGVVTLVGPVIARMQAARSDYHQADQIPTSWLPMTSATWLFLGIALLLILAGALVLTTRSQLALAALGVIGLGMATAPLVIDIPAKVDAAVRVSRLGAVGLAPGTGQKAVAATNLFDGLAADVTAKLEPALAAPGRDPVAARAEFTRAYPALAGFATTWEASTSAKSHALAGSQVALAPIFTNAHRLPLRPIPWLFILPGVALALLTDLAFVLAFRIDGVRLSRPVPRLDPVPAQPY